MMQHNISQKQITYYDILEISQGASAEEIKQAYRRLVLKWHPDRNRAAQRDAHRKLQTLNEAYAHLKDTEARARYDQMLKRKRDMLQPRNDNNGAPSRMGQFWGWLFAHDQSDLK